MLNWLLAGPGNLFYNTSDGIPVGASPRKFRLFTVAKCRLVWDKLTDSVECCCKRTERTAWIVGDSKGMRCEFCDERGYFSSSRRAVETAERFADGEGSEADMLSARQQAHVIWSGTGVANLVGLAYYAAHENLKLAVYAGTSDVFLGVPRPGVHVELLRSIVGNPFRSTSEREHLSPTVVSLAHAMYSNRDFSALPILWDALEDADCSDETVRRHCMGYERCGNLQHNDKDTASHTDHCGFCDGSGWRPRKCPSFRGDWLIDAILGKG